MVPLTPTLGGYIVFHCGNTRGQGPHQHSTVIESKQCYGILPRPPVFKPVEADITPKQQRFISDLGGDPWRYQTLREASRYIDELQAQKASATVTTPPVIDPRISMVEMLLEQVTDGRFMIEDNQGHKRFYRLSRPKTGRRAGHTFLQSQHSEQWVNRLVKYPDGNWRKYSDGDTLDHFLKILVDPKEAGFAYAKELGQCAKCGKTLTNDKEPHDSLRWGIGPECVKKDPGWIPWVMHLEREREEARA